MAFEHNMLLRLSFVDNQTRGVVKQRTAHSPLQYLVR